MTKYNKLSTSWEARNPDRAKVGAQARWAVYVAVRLGKLQRPDICEECGGPGPIQAAHTDYAKPLEVRWLCRRCHIRWDRSEPKTLQVREVHLADYIETESLPDSISEEYTS